MNVFVTGASGFIGSHLVNRLKGKNKVVCLVRDLLTSPWVKWTSEALTPSVYVRGDVLDCKLVRRILADYEIENVYHLASQAIVKTALKDPFGTFQTNIMGTVNLLEACRQVDVEKIYIQSTDKIYGERTDATEEAPLASAGPYPTSKSCEDLVAQTYLSTYGMNIVIGRACNTYGYDMASRIVSNTIRSCLRGEPPIIYEGEETLRQYIYVEDLVSAIENLTLKWTGIKNGIFNIGTDDRLKQEEVVKEICRYFPITPRLVKREEPIKEIQRQTVRWDKLFLLGWRPAYTFGQGIQLTIEKFKRYGF